MTRAHLELALIALLAIAGLAWCQADRERAGAVAVAGHWQRKADAAVVVADSALAVVDESERARRAVEVQARAEVERAESARRAAEERARAAESRRPEAVERVVRAAGPDSAAVREAVGELEAVHEEERGAWMDVMAAQDSIIQAQLRQLDATEQLAYDLRTALDASQAALSLSRVEADAWERAARPGFLGLRVSVPPEWAFVGGAVMGGVSVALASR
jgi:hypothetical protein